MGSPFSRYCPRLNRRPPAYSCTRQTAAKFTTRTPPSPSRQTPVPAPSR
jgi:hypothetical protein